MKSKTPKTTSRLKLVLNVVLVTVVTVAILFLPLAIALLLFLSLIYYWFAAWHLPEPKNADDFTFTTTELKTFEALQPLDKNLRRSLSELWKQGSHLQKRKDGYFSERSKLGKQLNPEIKQLEEELSENGNFVIEYGAFADERKRHYLRIKSRRLATTLTAIIYGLVITLLHYLPNSLVEKISQTINNVGVLAPPEAFPQLWGTMAVATVTALAAFVPIKALSGFLARLKLNLGVAMDAGDAIQFSGRYAAHSGIGEA